jgi:NADP-dependent 3-hydroxy acid dehydrogenase YdfG
MSKQRPPQHVLITGAGSGIGQQTALAFAQRGATLELVDIDGDGLAKTKELCRAHAAAVHLQRVDVTDAEAMLELARVVHTRVQALDVLVNNAGIGAAGRFLEASLAIWKKTLDVNLMGVVHGCRAFLPAMIARGQGGNVVNVASAAGLAGLAEMPVYCTSKFAVVGLSESLRADMRQHRIQVACICPGIIDTPIVQNTHYEGARFTTGATQEAIHKLYRRRAYPASKVAAAIVCATERDAGLVPVTPESWFIWLSQRALPGLVTRLGSGEKLLSRFSKGG